MPGTGEEMSLQVRNFPDWDRLRAAIPGMTLWSGGRIKTFETGFADRQFGRSSTHTGDTTYGGLPVLRCGTGGWPARPSAAWGRADASGRKPGHVPGRCPPAQASGLPTPRADTR